MGSANRLRLSALNLAIIFIFCPNSASAILTRTHVHGYTAESNNLGDSQYSSLNGTKRARHLNTNRTECEPPQRYPDPRLKCKWNYRDACIIQLEGHTERHMHTYVLGHMSIKREEYGKIAHWQRDKRYFVLNVDECKLSYGQYNDKIDAECEPWQIGEPDDGNIVGKENKGSDIVLKENKGHPTRTLDLNPAAVLQRQDSIVFETRYKAKGASEFNKGQKFHVREKSTKDKGIHHYRYIGTDRQLYPSMESLRNVLECRAFLKRLDENEGKNENAGVRALENPKYENFKKLMCLMDIPEDETLELGARTIAFTEYTQLRGMDRSDVGNGLKDIINSDLTATRGMTNKFSLENLRKVDSCRSVDGFNNPARKSIQKYFKDGSDTSLVGWLSVMVKAMYRDMWSAKFGPHSSYLHPTPLEPVTVEPLFRGQTESKDFVNMIYQKIGKVGEFAFDRIAGFTDDEKLAIGFFLGGDEKRDQRVLFYLEPTAMARPISNSKYDNERERMILPYVPLTVEYASTLKEIKTKDLNLLDEKRFPNIVSIAEDLGGLIDHQKKVKQKQSGGEIHVDLSKVHLVVLGVPDINFVDPKHPMFISEEEKNALSHIFGPTKQHYCDPNDVPNVVPTPDHEQDLMNLLDEIMAENKLRREAKREEEAKKNK